VDLLPALDPRRNLRGGGSGVVPGEDVCGTRLEQIPALVLVEGAAPRRHGDDASETVCARSPDELVQPVVDALKGEYAGTARRIEIERAKLDPDRTQCALECLLREPPRRAGEVEPRACHQCTRS